MSIHAVLSPSSASQWSSCHAAPAMQMNLPDSSSEHAAEGTAMHEAGEKCLNENIDAASLIGQSFNGFVMDEDMADMLQRGYINQVRMIGGMLMVEQRLPISHITGEVGAHGTSDAVIVLPTELVVGDLKWGMGVKVDAEENEQLIMYGLSALEEFSLLGDFETVRLMIFQPRLNHISEWVVPVAEMLAWGERLKLMAAKATEVIDYTKQHGKLNLQTVRADEFAPSDDNCRWCKAKTDCVPLRDFVMATVADDFVDITGDIGSHLGGINERVANCDNAHLAALMPHLDLIQSWCKAVMARCEAEIHAGRHIAGYKLVQGKRGNRKWLNEADAEAAMKKMRLKLHEMYDFKLISPASAEKVLKESPRKWPKLQALIVQSDGSPTVVPESDKRPAITVTSVADDFDNLFSKE